MRIFVYEPEKTIGEMLQYYLEEQGHEVHIYNDEIEALSYIGASFFEYFILAHCFKDNLKRFTDFTTVKNTLLLTTVYYGCLPDCLKDYSVLYKPFALEELDCLRSFH